MGAMNESPTQDPLAAGPKRDRAVREMFDRIAPRYDRVNRLMTFGLDIGWRRRAVAELGLARGSLTLDVGCGTGDFIRELQRSGHQAVGVDLSEGMLRAAPPGLRLVHADALLLPMPERAFDGVTSGFALRNVVDPGLMLAEMGRVTRPGGRLALLEVAEPEWALARLFHRFYFHRVVPLIGGLLSDRQAYQYLPKSTSYLPDHPAMVRLLDEAGFVGVRRRLLGAGAAQLITATRA
jgi:demethylmenaquinone methyltransferase/2-methoxy-6-polyprenyl-1,4-benzoquinol methylase